MDPILFWKIQPFDLMIFVWLKIKLKNFNNVLCVLKYTSWKVMRPNDGRSLQTFTFGCPAFGVITIGAPMSLSQVETIAQCNHNNKRGRESFHWIVVVKYIYFTLNCKWEIKWVFIENMTVLPIRDLDMIFFPFHELIICWCLLL